MDDKVVKYNSIADGVLAQVKKFQSLGDLVLPKDYNAGNALKAAHLILLEKKNTKEESVFKCCSIESISKALLEMVTQGLDPTKSQCSFIIRGNKLYCQKEYFGNMKIAMRNNDIGIPKAHTIYEGDVIEYHVDLVSGKTIIDKYETKFQNIDINKIIGAFCIIPYNDGTSDATIMTFDEIKKCWLQGTGKGNTPAHNNFTNEMCEKTVINRACKPYVNSTSDIFNDFDAESIDIKQIEKINIDQEVKKEPIDSNITDVEVIEEVETPKVEEAPKVEEVQEIKATF